MASVQLFLICICFQLLQCESRRQGEGRASGRKAHHLQAAEDRVASFNISDGSIVDCVRIDRQPSLKHPILVNHRIHTTPSFPPSSPPKMLKTDTDFSSSQPWQLFHLEHTSCPDGSIPVQRFIPNADASLSRKSISSSKYPAKNARNSTTGVRSRLRVEPPSADGTHQYAIVESVGSFSGAQAFLSVWDPAVASASDFSLSQLWVGAGSEGDINTVEAGWQVYEVLNGDTNPHLFIFWTADSYTATGCYNLRCPGFVQTNPRVVLGGAISTVSSPDSSLFFKKFLIYKDPSAWWLQIDSEWIGYWPGELFTTLRQSAEWLQWGGEVCLSQGSDSITEMGSGYFPWEGNSRAASQCELGYMDTSMNVFAATDLKQLSTDPDCYTAASYYDANWGSYIVFGGSGCHQ